LAVIIGFIDMIKSARLASSLVQIWQSASAAARRPQIGLRLSPK
jgi:hypothetical protein